MEKRGTNLYIRNNITVRRRSVKVCRAIAALGERDRKYGENSMKLAIRVVFNCKHVFLKLSLRLCDFQRIIAEAYLEHEKALPTRSVR